MMGLRRASTDNNRIIDWQLLECRTGNNSSNLGPAFTDFT